MRLRFFFDPGSGGSLWPGDAEALEAWDVGPLDERLPLGPETREALAELAAWWDTGLDWTDPAGPGLWGAWDRKRFHRAASRVLGRVRAELGLEVAAEGLEEPEEEAPLPPPPGVRRLEEPGEVEPLLAGEPELHLFARADLDPVLAPEAAFYEREGALVLGWYGLEPPCFSALGDSRAGDLLARLAPVLPPRFYLQTSPGLEAPLRDGFDLRREAGVERWVLRGLVPDPAEPVERLDPRHHRELRDLYAEAFPEGLLDPRTLATGRYAGLRREGRLVAAAGVHAWSPGRSVAVLGNVATRPSWRGQGLAASCVAGLCRRLQEEDGIRSVGLNVAVDNQPARSCYRRLGFQPVAFFEEWTALRRPGSGSRGR